MSFAARKVSCNFTNTQADLTSDTLRTSVFLFGNLQFSRRANRASICAKYFSVYQDYSFSFVAFANNDYTASVQFYSELYTSETFQLAHKLRIAFQKNASHCA